MSMFSVPSAPIKESYELVLFLPCHSLLEIWKHISEDPVHFPGRLLPAVKPVHLVDGRVGTETPLPAGDRICLCAPRSPWLRAGIPVPQPDPQTTFPPLRARRASQLHGASSCRVFFKPLCNLSFAGSIDKTFCCLFFDPKAADTFKLHLTQKFLSAKQTSRR